MTRNTLFVLPKTLIYIVGTARVIRTIGALKDIHNIWHEILNLS